MLAQRMRTRLAREIFPGVLRVYLAFKPRLRPLVTRYPRLYPLALRAKEAIKSLLLPGAASPPPVRPVASLAPQPGVPDIGYTGGPPGPRVPDWLVAEWREIHQLEPLLFPEPSRLNTIPFYEVPRSPIAEPYVDLCDRYGDSVTHVMLVPWLRKGGAELVTLNTLRALEQLSPRARVVVIATLDVKSEWSDRVPMTARFIDFGRLYAHLSVEQQEKLLTRVLLQMAPSVIHNINSELGYNIFIKYGNALANASRLYASSFCGDRSRDGRLVGYPFGPLNDCFDNLTAVLTDNKVHIDDMVSIYGMGRDKFICHYQPAPEVRSPKRFDAAAVGKRELDVLWAGRIDRQKRPDVLILVAAACRHLPVTFHVYGSSVMDGGDYTGQLRRLANVVFHGPFDGLTTVNATAFDLFLNTSEWDGLPNTLLEAVAMGLPVISSDVGGVGELIRDQDTGYLVTPFDNVGAYVSCLQAAMDNRAALAEVSRRALLLIRQRHSPEQFRETLQSVPGYVYPR